MEYNQHRAPRQVSRERLRCIRDLLALGEPELAADLLLQKDLCEVCGDRPAVRAAPDFETTTIQDAYGRYLKRVDGTMRCCEGCARDQENEALRLEYEASEGESDRMRNQ